MSIAKEASKQASNKQQASKQATEPQQQPHNLGILMRHTSRHLFLKGNEKQNDFRCRFCFRYGGSKCVQV